MNKRYIFEWTTREDLNLPNNNYNPEKESVVCEPPYDFGDFLSDADIYFEQEGNTYYVVEDDERTGEAYHVISIEDTEEPVK